MLDLNLNTENQIILGGKEKNQTHPLISIIIPTLNEEKAIRKVITEIPLDKLPDTEILVIDGFSTDKTREIAHECGAKVISQHKKGYGNAIYTGIKYAKGKIIVWIDSDYTYPSKQIPDLIKPILEGKADIVLGSRIKGKIYPGAMKLLHRFGNLYITLIYNILFWKRLSDTQTGFRAFRKDALLSMKLNNNGMGFATQTLTQGAKKRMRIKEIKIEYRPRIGCSKLHSFRDGARILAEIFRSIFT
ncbi:MAG: glycosyltransferase family 2 protein [Candidatus Helarchaeota archaeon]